MKKMLVSALLLAGCTAFAANSSTAGNVIPKGGSFVSPAIVSLDTIPKSTHHRMDSDTTRTKNKSSKSHSGKGMGSSSTSGKGTGSGSQKRPYGTNSQGKRDTTSTTTP